MYISLTGAYLASGGLLFGGFILGHLTGFIAGRRG